MSKPVLFQGDKVTLPNGEKGRIVTFEGAIAKVKRYDGTHTRIHMNDLTAGW